MKYFNYLIISIINLYAYIISPVLGVRCRFQPTCSEYARESLNQHGLFWGSYLSLKRILKCHPFGSSGYDPVPFSINKPNQTDN